jgi:hypothetical protein
VISNISLGNQWGDGFKGGEDGQFLAVSVPNQDFVEEPEALDGWRKSRFAASTVTRGSVDPAYVAAKSVVDGHYCVHWFCHFLSLLVLSTINRLMGNHFFNIKNRRFLNIKKVNPSDFSDRYLVL